MNPTIKLTYKEKTFTLPTATKVETIIREYLKIECDKLTFFDNPVVALRMNNEILPFGARVTINATIEPVHLYSDLGKRIYRHSLSYLLSYASNLLFPKKRLIIGHALGDGFYFTFQNQSKLEKGDVMALSDKMRELVQQNLPLELVRVAYQEGVDYFKEKGFLATELLLNYRNDSTIHLYRCEDYLDIAYEPLLSRTGLLEVWELKEYGDEGMLLRYPLTKNKFQTVAPFKDNPLLFSVFSEYRRWATLLKVDCIGTMNQICGSKDIGTFIRMNEDLHHRKISDIADMIDQKEGVKTVLISGPSSSGKTTFSIRLAIQLKLLGFDPIKISLDNYYRPKSQVPKDLDGNPDLEILEALDLDLLRENLAALYRNEEVYLPHFEFSGDGKRTFEKEPISLKEDTILVLEGIHALNPRLLGDIDDSSTFKIYISALTQLNLDDHNRISTTDNRILRRIVRDNKSRSTSAQQTLEMWPSVERGESINIFPYQNEADIMINSALDYELAVLKPYAEPLLKTVKPSAYNAYPVARRLLKFLENVYPIPPNLVPSDSLLREFIGDSEFHSEC